MASARAAPHSFERRYLPPTIVARVELKQLLEEIGRPALADKQFDFLQVAPGGTKIYLYYAGNLSLLKRPAVSIVGTREVTPDGASRARKLSRELASADVLVVSGLAKGVDTAAHTAAIEFGGATAAVIGTPLEKAYPIENAPLQEQIYREYVLLSPFAPGERVYRGNFPKRNRVMAAITDATVIVEASNSSGALHQAAECLRLGRWLFILRSVVENPAVTWPQRFLSSKTVIVDSTADVFSKLKKL
jgi:DNA processing protein